MNSKTLIPASPVPFALPQHIEPELGALRHYWEGLRRTQNPIPFADDLNLDHLPQFVPRLVVLDVFEKPQRFRFAVVGSEITQRYGGELASRFLDELSAHPPLDYLLSQCFAVTQSGAATWFRTQEGYARLLLPLWGNGYVSTLLGGFWWDCPHRVA